MKPSDICPEHTAVIKAVLKVCLEEQGVPVLDMDGLITEEMLVQLSFRLYTAAERIVRKKLRYLNYG